MKQYGTFLRSALVLGCLAFAHTALSNAPLYWQDRIDQALDSRDSFLQRAGLGSRPLQSIRTTDAATGNQLLARLAAYADSSEPWYHLFAGELKASRDPEEADRHIRRAITTAASDPGELWVVFMGLRSSGRHESAGRCLDLLEKKLLEEGAGQVSLVSFQLLAAAQEDKDPALYDRALQFTREPFWLLQHKVWSALPARPIAALGAVSDCIRAVRSTWNTQLELAYLGHRWLKTALTLFTTICLLALAVRILPSALHPVVELYPVTISPWLRHTPVIVAYLSLVAFGWYPFLVLTAILLWGRASTRERIVLAGCLSILIAAPLTTPLEAMLHNGIHPAKAISLYRRAMHEGYQPRLDAEITDYLKRHPDDALGSLAAAVSRYKADDIEMAAAHIYSAERLRPDDPVITITSGIIQFALGRYDRAEQKFNRCMDQFPDYESAYYNLGRCYMATRQALRSTDLHRQARDAAQRSAPYQNQVELFVGRNDRHFEEQIPRLRRMMLPDYKVYYFWADLLPAYGKSAQTTADLWGPSLFGVGPVISSIIVLVAATLAMAAANQAAKRRSRDERNRCMLCGVPTCRKCRAGRVCLSCHRAGEKVENVAVRRRVEEGISARATSIEGGIAAVTDLLIPGSGILIRGEAPLWKGVGLIALVSLIFATYIALLAFPSPVPSGLTKGWSIALPAAAGLLHLPAVAGSIARLRRRGDSQGGAPWH